MPLRLAHRPDWSRLLFDRGNIVIDSPPVWPEAERRDMLQARLNFFWAMTAVALKEAGRGYTTGAVSTIRLMSDSFDLLWRVLFGPEDGNATHRATRHRKATPELERLIPRLGAEINPQTALEVIRHLCVGVEKMHSTLAAQGVSVPEAMPAEMRKLSALATTIQGG